MIENFLNKIFRKMILLDGSSKNFRISLNDINNNNKLNF